jgi:3-oxoacyl-[acyl-carrier-protein] synthase-3/clorobiocin biosynthesis protein CloN2
MSPATGVWLAAVGSYLPPSRNAAQSDGAAQAGGPAREQTGQVTVAGNVSAPDMALQAARRALRAGNVPVREISLLLYSDVWHQGPDGWMPHAYLQRHLGADQALAAELRGGCTGMFTAIDLAASHLRAGGAGEVALLVASENFGTKLVDRWCMGPFQGAVGDGATALLLARGTGFAQVLSSTSGTFAALEEVHRGAEPIFPPSVTEGRYMDLGARANEFQIRATKEARWLALMMEHREHVIDVVEQALADADLTRADVAKVLLHSMPRDTAAAFLRSIGFAIEDSSWQFGQATGHVGASDHVLALQHLILQRQLHPGDRVLLTGFSPGLTYKAMVLQIADVDELEAMVR